MIPAILTCVFVIYLYQSLNHPEKVSEAAASGTQPSVSDLNGRLDALQTRIQTLIDHNQRGTQS